VATVFNTLASGWLHLMHSGARLFKARQPERNKKIHALFFVYKKESKHTGVIKKPWLFRKKKENN
jgi:hypothetical protein